jgi:hypothetical protein
MSGSVTLQASSSKCNGRSNDSGIAAVGGSAANRYKTTSAMECCIKSLKDQLKVAMGKTPNGAIKFKGDRKKSRQGILKKKGTPAAPKKTTAHHAFQDVQMQRRKQQRFHMCQRNEKSQGLQSLI